MKTVIGLVFCLLLGAMLKIQGITALAWFPIGLVLGLYVTAQVVLPVLLGIPRAIKLIAAGQMRPKAVGYIMLMPVIWFALLFAVGFFWPAAVEYLGRNAAFLIGNSLGFAVIILSPLSKRSRADFSEDFEKAYARFYTDKAMATMRTHETQVKAADLETGSHWNARQFDPEESEEQEADLEIDRLKGEVVRLKGMIDAELKKAEAQHLEVEGVWYQAELAYAEALRLSPADEDARIGLERVKSRRSQALDEAIFCLRASCPTCGAEYEMCVSPKEGPRPLPCGCNWPESSLDH
jgi:hypothetical protein